MSDLYPYQQRVLAALSQGKNVIIQAPTGAGKTRAALYPYFHMLDAYNGMPNAPLPVTCRYAVPMRVLATQFESEYHHYFAKLDHKRGTDFMRRYHDTLGLPVPALQTGETPNDPQFESLLTFCTIDQLLASFIGTPYAMGQSRANLNVGAVVGSYLILDEFHLYPLEKTGNGARMTTLAMLQMLAGLSPFVMMTATFSTHLLASLGTLLNAEVVRVTDEAELATIMRGRSRTIRRVNDVLSPDAILAAHTDASTRGAGASLVVCNTVARAQGIYQQLCAALQHQGIADRYNVQLLHSRFTQEDRKQKSDALEHWLGEACWKDGRFIPSDGKEVIVVGTQAIEVGLNISAGVLHTELAPANSLIQRAGRCARFAEQKGEVIVYQIPLREGAEKVSYKPYEDAPCEATWEYLGARCADAGGSLTFGFIEEQALIDHVHTQADTAMIAAFGKGDMALKRTIKKVLATHERGKERELIRDVAQVNIIIHPAPHEAITEKPFAWQAFGLHPGTLAGAWTALHDRAQALGVEWTISELQAMGDAQGADGDNDHPLTYTWTPMSLSDKNAHSLIRAALRVALPPQLATYDSDLGFRLLLTPDAPAGTWHSTKQSINNGNRRNDDIGKQGSYVEHISGLMRAYRLSVRAEFAWVAQRLERVMQLPPGKLDLALRLAIACHDIGKLSLGWQRWAYAWQGLLVEKRGVGYAVKSNNTWLAKTDRLATHEWRMERDWQKELGITRPHHACEGAIASEMFIGASLLGDAETLTDAQREHIESLIYGTISAIARHHTPLASTHEAVGWDAAAHTAIHEALTACDIPIDATTDYIDLAARTKGPIEPDHLVSPTSAPLHTTWLSFALVRALRLCDQRAERI